MEKKMEEIKQKENEVNKWISTLKMRGENYKSQINENFEVIIKIINARKQLLFDRVNHIISFQTQQCLDHIKQLQTCYQNFFAYSKKVEEMWKENTLELKEREEQIIKQTNLLTQKYDQFNSNSSIFRHPCYVYFQNQSLIQELNQFENVTDKRMCQLEIKVKAKTFRNVTIEWHNTEQENNEDLISGDEFLIQYMSNSTEMKDENKEEKWNEIKVKKKKGKE